jgi:hypothetical protein
LVFSPKDAKRRPNLGKWTHPLRLCTEHGEIRAVQSFKKAERWVRYRDQYVYRCGRCAVVVEPAWLPASSTIDWSIPGERIGDRKKPLADKTRLWIEKGIERHWKTLVVAAAGNTYDSASGKTASYLRAWPTTDALRTLSGTAELGLAVPPLVVNNVSGADESRSRPSSDPCLRSSVAAPRFPARARRRSRRESAALTPRVATPPPRLLQHTRTRMREELRLPMPQREKMKCESQLLPADVASAVSPICSVTSIMRPCV